MDEFLCYIPSYNDSELVAESLSTCGDWRVVISDNASAEPHRARLAGLAGPRVQVIRHEQSLGRIGNWTACVRHFAASGASWMKFLMAGDRLDTAALDIFKSAIAHYPKARLLIGQIDSFLPQERRPWQPTREYLELVPRQVMNEVAIHCNIFFGLAATLIHVDPIRGGFTFGDEVLNYCADTQFHISIARRVGCLYVPQIVAQFMATRRKHFLAGHGGLEHRLEEGLLQLRAAQALCEMTGDVDGKAEFEGYICNQVSKALLSIAQARAAAKQRPAASEAPNQ